jgi:UDP-2-acetamido-3-amino-2,3-dideoxy-glucuronate N-acetyltransferase
VRVVRAEPVLVRVDEREPLREECAHFLSCVAASKTPRTDSVEGLRVLRVLDAAANSMALGGETIRTRSTPAGLANISVN